MGYKKWKHRSLAETDLHQMELFLNQLAWCIPDADDRTETENKFYYTIREMQSIMQKLFEENGKPTL